MRRGSVGERRKMSKAGEALNAPLTTLKCRMSLPEIMNHGWPPTARQKRDSLLLPPKAESRSGPASDIIDSTAFPLLLSK